MASWSAWRSARRGCVGRAVRKVKGGFIVQRDAEIAKNEPGTHNGGGQTIGYSFFDKTPGMKFVFRKRALHPGAGVGHHEQHEDEVYYVLSGKGVMTVDDTPVEMTPGTAVLTRPGSSHSLKQVGAEDLVGVDLVRDQVGSSG